MNSKGAISTKGIAWTAIVLFLVVGGIVVGMKRVPKKPQKNSNTSAAQSGTPEGGQVTIPAPSTGAMPTGAVTATFYDAGAHGWHAVQSGGGNYMQYDGTTGLKYTATATKDASGSYSATVPDDICGDVILPQGAPAPAPKVIEVTLTGSDGKPLPGTTPTKFDLKCDVYTLAATIKANPDKLLADGIAA
jgi:hypothetical protein